MSKESSSEILRLAEEFQEAYGMPPEVTISSLSGLGERPPLEDVIEAVKGEEETRIASAAARIKNK